MYSNTPKIVGAGGGPFNEKKLNKAKRGMVSAFNQDRKPAKQRSQGKRRMPKPMPYYPSTGTNQRPGGMTDDMKTKISSRIQSWQDRNLDNRGSKLNP